MKKLKFGGFPIILTFVMFAVSSIWSDAFGNCEVVLNKGGYRCSFKAFNKTRTDTAFLGGTFVPNNTGGVFDPPFLFEIACLHVELVDDENQAQNTFGRSDGVALRCGCNPYSALLPILNASDVFTCVAPPETEDSISFSGRPILGGLKIVNSHLTFNTSFSYSNVIGYCVPDPTPCE
jgi:hypothetical protein